MKYQDSGGSRQTNIEQKPYAKRILMDHKLSSLAIRKKLQIVRAVHQWNRPSQELVDCLKYLKRGYMSICQKYCSEFLHWGERTGLDYFQCPFQLLHSFDSIIKNILQVILSTF